MRQRPFGTTGLSVSEVGVGCSRLGGMFSTGSSPRGRARTAARRRSTPASTFFDTSDLYSHGQSEVLVGKAIRSRRAEVVLATKGGYVRRGQRPVARPAQAAAAPGRAGPRRQAPGRSASGAGSGGADPAGLHARRTSPAAVEASLRRLGTDYIDIYQLHSPPRGRDRAPASTSPSSTELKAQGKIRHYGIAADARRRRGARSTATRRHVAAAPVQRHRPDRGGGRAAEARGGRSRRHLPVVLRRRAARGIAIGGRAARRRRRTGRPSLALPGDGGRAGPAAEGAGAAVQPGTRRRSR